MPVNKKHQQFIATVWEYYERHARNDLPWRQPNANGAFDTYCILVSEVMLQQTQVSRVIEKYQPFLQKFPSVQALASAPLSAVLIAWQGLGYNRRAQFLHAAAQQLAGKKIWDYDSLVSCKGIGPNTAAAVMVYAYNQTQVFIETNIRTVYIHHYFPERTDVHDKELLPIILATVSKEKPREWYWALMDYGTYLKKSVGNLAKSSKHYAKQSRFEGSKRQLRGQILRDLASSPTTLSDLQRSINDDRLQLVLDDLERERLVMRRKQQYALMDQLNS